MRARFAVASILTLLPRLALADAPAGGLPVEARPSIHARELEAWKAREAAGWSPAPDPRAETVALVPRAGALGREVHGYHPYWMGSSYTGYDWSLLSTIAFFSLELDGAGQITDDHGWPWTTLVSTAHLNGVRVIVTATLFSSAGIDALLGSATNRANAIANLVSAVVSGGADGVNVDFEGVPGSRKQDLVTFLGELAAALDAQVADPYLSIATPAVDWSNAFDYDELAARCDHLMVMAYDYHWPGSTTTGPVSPLSGWGAHNVSWTVGDYQTWGATPDKMLLGVPYYGYRWGAASGAAGAATTSTGVARIYDQAQSEAGASELLWDGTSSTPWYRYQSPGWLQGWYDDAGSLGAKYALVALEDLAGVGIWALGYDGSRPELWSALGDAFANGTSAPTPAPAPWARLSHAGANPFRESARFAFEIGRSTPIRLAVFDVTGRLVRTLVDGRRAPGPGVATWDGRDAAGRPVGAGVYYVRLETNDGRHLLPVVRLR